MYTYFTFVKYAHIGLQSFRPKTSSPQLLSPQIDDLKLDSPHCKNSFRPNIISVRPNKISVRPTSSLSSPNIVSVIAGRTVEIHYQLVP
jgi:hypothetical protein